MASGVNPIVSGLLHGFELASNLKHQRLQQEALDRQVQRDADDKQIRTLQTQMALSDRGYKPSTPDQDAEAATGMKAPGTTPVMGDVLGRSMPTPATTSDIKTRMAKFNGQTYVRPSDDELVQRGEATAERAFGRKVRETKVLSDVKTQAKAAEFQAQMDTFSTPLSDEAAAAIGLAPGTRIMQGPGFAGSIGAVARAGKPAPPKVGTSVNAKGDVTPTAVSVGKDGKPVLTVGTAAEGIAKPVKATGGMTPLQEENLKLRKAQADAKAIKDHEKAQNDAQKEINKLNGQEQKFHAENRLLGERALALGRGKATDKKGKAYVPDAGTRESDLANIKARIASNQQQVKALQDQQHSIIMKFAGTPSNPYATANPY